MQFNIYYKIQNYEEINLFAYSDYDNNHELH